MKKLETGDKRPIKTNSKRAGLQGAVVNPGNTTLTSHDGCCDAKLSSSCCDAQECSDAANSSCCDAEPSICCEPVGGEACCCDAGPSCKETNASCDETGCDDVRSCIPQKKMENWMTGFLKTPAGPIAQVSTRIDRNDRLGSIKVRLGIGRMNYSVSPGIYAIGDPDEKSPIIVTANYKLTFDKVRSALAGLNIWLLILDTKGVNVWCAAGKGTFGTKEVIRQITNCELQKIVAHRTLILPQLGATGVSAHEVTKKTGFKVAYGPVRIQDVQEFIRNGSKAARAMRQVRFTAADRIVLTPIELYNALKTAIIVLGILFLFNLVLKNPFGWTDVYAYLGSLVAGCVLTPLLLPWIPGKAFAWKGFLLGLAWAFAVNAFHSWPGMMDYGLFRALGYFFALPAISAYYAMMFTGSSTYTSLSGVKKEMRIAVPIILGLLAIGAVLLILSGFAIL